MTAWNEAVPAQDGLATSKTLGPAKTIESRSSLPAGQTVSGDGTGDPLGAPDAKFREAKATLDRGWKPIRLHHIVADGTCSCPKGAACTHPGKHPVEDGWQTATVSQADVWSVWDVENGLGIDPQANIGVQTGWASHGLLVVDIDRKPALDELVERFGAEITDTYTVQTGSGGWHLYFSLPEDVALGNTKGKLTPGVDTRGENGQVLAPGSVTDKGAYRVLEDRPVRPILAPLLEVLLASQRHDVPDTTVAVAPRTSPPTPLEAEYVRKGIGYELARLDRLKEQYRPDWKQGDPGGGWDQTCFEVCSNVIELVNTQAGPTLAEVKAEVLGRMPTDGKWTKGSTEGKWQHAYGRKKDLARKLPDSVLQPAAISADALIAAADTAEQEDDDTDTADQGGEGAEKEAKKKGPAQSDILMALALESYDFRRAETGSVYALPKGGPHVARPLRGGSRSFRAELAAAYYARRGRVASTGALSSTLETLEGQAGNCEPIQLHLRVAEHDGAFWLDLGDLTGRAVKVTGAGWSVEDQPPVWFRRTELTAALPEPVRGDRGAALDELWALVNIAENDRPLVLAAQVATLWPDIPHPPTFLQAQPGAAKTSTTKALISVLDPSTAAVSAQPTSVDEWVTAAAGSQVVGIDNVSAIPEWFSDALCRASTGEAMKKRKLYTDTDLSVVTFRRMVYLTGMSILGVKDDLADRALSIELNKPTRRLTETVMKAAWIDAHPRILGAVLDLTCAVMAELPGVSWDDLPRMADFYRILLAVDAVLGNGGAGAKRYDEMTKNIAAEMAGDDPVLRALGQDITRMWEGTSAELLEMLDTRWAEGLVKRPKNWPNGPKSLTRRLTEAIPTLEQLGWTVAKQSRAGHEKAVRWLLAPPAGDHSE